VAQSRELSEFLLKKKKKNVGYNNTICVGILNNNESDILYFHRKYIFMYARTLSDGNSLQNINCIEDTT